MESPQRSSRETHFEAANPRFESAPRIPFFSGANIPDVNRAPLDDLGPPSKGVRSRHSLYYFTFSRSFIFIDFIFDHCCTPANRYFIHLLISPRPPADIIFIISHFLIIPAPRQGGVLFIYSAPTTDGYPLHSFDLCITSVTNKEINVPADPRSAIFHCRNSEVF